MVVSSSSPLHTLKPLRRRWLNRAFAVIYTFTILALLYRNFLNLINSPTLVSISLLLADLVFAFMFITCQAFFLNPIQRDVFPENIPQVAKESEYPALDVFICTADPYKEPPIGVVNTALSVMAYDCPKDKLSVYVSDDGGSQLTLFAFMEAAKFARYWLPYCRKYNIADRSPDVYFRHDTVLLPETDQMKVRYESMKAKVETVVQRGTVCPEDFKDEQVHKAFNKWSDNFSRQHHPTIVEVLLESGTDKDATDCDMPNLVYVSREKNKVRPHHFKAGALNVLLRVSGTMTNAPMFLVLDCDMKSNDSKAPLRALCYFLGPYADSRIGFVQFPQRFHGINKNDIYACGHMVDTKIFALGIDGLFGPYFMGTGGFFQRQALFGGPSSVVPSEIFLDSPQHLETKSIKSEDVLTSAHHVASCHYEDNTKWGSEVGFRYESLTEDVYTGYKLHCQGWKSILCDPNRPAFLGDAPISLSDVLNQTKRWCFGFLEISLTKYSPITFGIRSMDPFQALCYTHFTFRAIWSIPITIYAFMPQLALLNSYPIFPKVSDAWFSLYAFLFLGAYGKDFLDFILVGGSVQRWWSTQRMWMIRGLSSFLFALFEWSLKSLGMSTSGFNVTSKVVDDEQSKRYEQGVFEFGVASPLFLPISSAALINLFSFFGGIIQVSKNGSIEELYVQIFLAGFVVVNSWPIYEAMFLRSDKGKMPLKVTLTSAVVALVLYLASYLAF